MTMSYRISGISTVDPTTASRIRHGMLFSARLIFWPLALLTLVMLAIQLGAWRTEFNIAGPFAAETSPARHSLILVVPNEGPAAWWRQPLIGDTSEKSFQSNLELRIDGREMALRIACTKRSGGKNDRLQPLGPRLIFSLPPNVKNAPETIATLRYSVRPRAWVTFALTVRAHCSAGFYIAERLGPSCRVIKTLTDFVNQP